MEDNKLSRREFLKYTSSLALAMASYGLLDNNLFAAEKFNSKIFKNLKEQTAFNARFDAKGLPTAQFGNTGVIVPKMGLGLGSRYCAFALKEHDAAIEMLNYALDKGFYYWDTAPIYSAVDKATNRTVYCEELAGEVVKHRRKEIFLNGKLCSRNPDELMASVERTLKLLNTDYLDMMMVHGIESMEDFQRVIDNKLIERLTDLRSQGLFKVFGFSGHGEGAPLLAAVNTGCFDTALLAIDPYRYSKSGSREGMVVNAAAERNMGIMMMKTVRGYTDNLKPGEKINDLEAGIIRSWEIPGATGVMVGMDSKEIVDKNLALIKRVFK